LDVLILCGGSRTDLPEQTPELAARFTVVDSFDTHARIPEHYEAVGAKISATTAIISTGWDPGLFSINRVYAEAVLPTGQTSTFWGKGLSQGHSDAVRRVPGVAAGVQYTIPAPEAMEAARAGRAGEAPASSKHERHCYVVPEDGADPETIREAIVTMPDYFADYDTTVEFITAEELETNHQGMPHGGFVIRSGLTSAESRQVIEYSLALGSNPEFTASVLVAYARAAHRLHTRGAHGVFSPSDIAPGLFHPAGPAHLLANRPLQSNADTTAELPGYLNELYPQDTAEAWDAVGLTVGEPDARVGTALFAVDIDPIVVAEAIDLGADLIVTHHPLFLSGTITVAANTPKGRMVHD